MELIENNDITDLIETYEQQLKDFEKVKENYKIALELYNIETRIKIVIAQLKNEILSSKENQILDNRASQKQKMRFEMERWRINNTKNEKQRTIGQHPSV